MAFDEFAPTLGEYFSHVGLGARSMLANDGSPFFKRMTLQTNPLFQAMTPRELDAMLNFATEKHVPRGVTIFSKGELGLSIMIVLRGRVKLSAVSSYGKELTLNFINPGEIFGEITLFDGQPHEVDAIAMDDTTLLVVQREQFMDVLRGNSELLLHVVGVICQRFRQISIAFEDLAVLDLPGRLARVLLKLAGDYGRPIAGGTQIEIRLSQQDLSALVASSRESVNKVMRDWYECGWLSLNGRYITVRQPLELGRLTTS